MVARRRLAGRAISRGRPRVSPAHPSVGAGLAEALSPSLSEPLAYLTGTWSLERRLEDADLGAEGHFVGIARVDPLGERRFRYHEEGLLQWQGYRGQASRTLLLAPIGPATVAFSFPDGRFFHLLQLRPDGYRALHECGEDRYEGAFALKGPDAWSATWRVTGPRKALVLSGSYQRLATREGEG